MPIRSHRGQLHKLNTENGKWFLKSEKYNTVMFNVMFTIILIWNVRYCCKNSHHTIYALFCSIIICGNHMGMFLVENKKMMMIKTYICITIFRVRKWTWNAWSRKRKQTSFLFFSIDKSSREVCLISLKKARLDSSVDVQMELLYYIWNDGIDLIVLFSIS